MVLYGDSHALMWFEAFDAIAKQAEWRLVVLGKDWCHVSLVPRTNPTGFGSPGGRYTQCDAWHRFAMQRINELDPDLLVVTEEPGGRRYPSGKHHPGSVGSKGSSTHSTTSPLPTPGRWCWGTFPSPPISTRIAWHSTNRTSRRVGD